MLWSRPCSSANEVRGSRNGPSFTRMIAIRRAQMHKTSRISAVLFRAQSRAVWPWFATGVAISGLLVADRVPGSLDRGSILAIGASVLAIVAVTFGVVAVLAQHLSETYARAISELFNRTAIWKIAVVSEGIAFVLSVTLAYWRPDATSGVVAILLAATSLVESWFAITQLLNYFDATVIIESLKVDALAAIEREPDKSSAAIQPSQAILNLILIAARKGDVEVVGSGLAAWNDILGRYLASASIVYGDPYLYWLEGRCGELVEEYAQQSIGLVLPVVVRGIGYLARSTASSRNPLNAALDEGTALFVRTLRSAVMITGQAPRSTAAGEAIEGIGAASLACLDVGKFTVAQFPIDELKTIGLAASTLAPGIASQSTIKLCETALALAKANSNDVMRLADAEVAVGAIDEIALRTIPRSGLDPIHFLTARLCRRQVCHWCAKRSLSRRGRQMMRTLHAHGTTWPVVRLTWESPYWRTQSTTQECVGTQWNQQAASCSASSQRSACSRTWS